MAQRKSSVVLNLYSINARQRDELLAYGDFFSQLASIDSADTVRSVPGGLSYAIDLDELIPSGGVGERSGSRTFVGRVIAGSPGEVPLYFDYKTGETEEGATPAGKWLAQVSRIVVRISASERYVAMDSRRTGVTISKLSRYLAELAEQVTSANVVEFDMLPVQSGSLRAEIESFQRIRQASAIISRPNFDWNDMSDQLSGLIDESGGHEGEATVRAGRGESLQKASGIVRSILDSIDSSVHAVRKFKVMGTKQHSDRETTITSEKHQRRAFARVDWSLPPGDVDATLFEAGMELIDETVDAAASAQRATSVRQSDDSVD